MSDALTTSIGPSDYLVLTSLLEDYPNDISPEHAKMFFTPIVACTKSTNSQVHLGAVTTFAALVSNHTLPTPVLQNMATELLALPKAGKTSSADHRRSLFAMLAVIPPSIEVSASVSSILPALLAKESSEPVIIAARDALAIHLPYLLTSNHAIPPDVTAIFVKESAGTKAPIRRAFLHIIGTVYEPRTSTATAEQNGAAASPDSTWSEASQKLADAILPSLESDLKATVTSPLNATVGPLEGYVAIATFLHPSSPIPKPRTFNPLRADLLITSPDEPVILFIYYRATSSVRSPIAHWLQAFFPAVG